MAFSLIATVGVLLIVMLQARRSEDALDGAASQTLRDYTGYAGRMIGAEVFRRAMEQRMNVLAPVLGYTGNDPRGPALREIARRGDASFVTLGNNTDSGIGYFRVPVPAGQTEGLGRVQGGFAAKLADTVRAIATAPPAEVRPNVIILPWRDTAYSVAFAPLTDAAGSITAMYGYTYTRARGVASIATRVFAETPLLPTSYTGVRWNYDTVSTRFADVGNHTLLGVRISDRAGKLLWASDGATAKMPSPYHERVVLSTSAGGMIIETAIQPASEQSLIPGVVRNAQQWSTRALFALTLLLLLVSIVALLGERRGARARRAEAMQQLSLGLRHEINNALASVLLNAELLGEEESLNAAQRERLEAIVEQSDRMRNVLRRIEKAEGLDVVPYLNEGYMVDLSPTSAPASQNR